MGRTNLYTQLRRTTHCTFKKSKKKTFVVVKIKLCNISIRACSTQDNLEEYILITRLFQGGTQFKQRETPYFFGKKQSNLI